MRYRIYSTWNWDNAEALLKDYPRLKDFAFEVEPIQLNYETREASYIDLQTLEDFLTLREAVGQPLIIGPGGNKNDIEIYDSYRE